MPSNMLILRDSIASRGVFFASSMVTVELDGEITQALVMRILLHTLLRFYFSRRGFPSPWSSPRFLRCPTSLLLISRPVSITTNMSTQLVGPFEEIEVQQFRWVHGTFSFYEIDFPGSEA